MQIRASRTKSKTPKKYSCPSSRGHRKYRYIYSQKIFSTSSYYYFNHLNLHFPKIQSNQLIMIIAIIQQHVQTIRKVKSKKKSLSDFSVPHHIMYVELWKLCKFSTFGFWRICTFWGLENPKNTKLAWCPGVRQLVCYCVSMLVSLLVCGDDIF